MATFKNQGTTVTDTSATTIYTVPNDATSAVILSLEVSNTSSSSTTARVDISWTDSSDSDTEYVLVESEAFGAITTKSLLPIRVVLEANDTLKFTSSASLDFDITVSVLEI